ncbi:MAG: YceI family protein [Planctomycetota bacterium]|jgi:polyisoprenoid-binding protein YceI
MKYLATPLLALLPLTALALLAPSGTATPAAAPTAPAATSYGVDLGHSTLMFRCKHLGVSYQWGRFDKFGGSFTLADDPAASMVEMTIDAASVNSNSAGRDDHLRGPDFFNVKQFPEITFKSKSVEGEGEEFVIAGDLTFHGVTKEVEMRVQKIGEADTKMGRRAGFEGRFVIDRTDFGVETYSETLGTDVTMTFAIEGIAKDS